MKFDEFLARLSALKQDRAIGPVKPYKPLLVLSVLLLIEKGKISEPQVWLDGALRGVFDQLLRRAYPGWRYRVDIRYPFRALENDGVWTLEAQADAVGRLELARSLGTRARQLLKHVAFARIDDTVFSTLLRSRDARRQALALVIDRYLPSGARVLIEQIIGSGDGALPPFTAAGRATERLIEEHLFQNWGSTPFAEMGVALAEPDRNGLPGRQVLTPVNSIDLLGFQAPAREWWVFELKRGRASDAVVGQVSRYLGWIVSERRGHGETARGVVLAEIADEKLRYSIRAHTPRLQLWTYDEDLRLTLAP